VKSSRSPIRTYCSRIAHERAKRIAWDDAKALREEVARRLATGHSETEVIAWLDELMKAAVLAQTVRTPIGTHFTPD